MFTILDNFDAAIKSIVQTLTELGYSPGACGGVDCPGETFTPNQGGDTAEKICGAIRALASEKGDKS